MAHVELRLEGGQNQVVKLDRVPVKGDYVVGRAGMLLVTDVALVAGGLLEAVAIAEKAENKALAPRPRAKGVRGKTPAPAAEKA
jgi:hypothetical protein